MTFRWMQLDEEVAIKMGMIMNLKKKMEKESINYGLINHCTIMWRTFARVPRQAEIELSLTKMFFFLKNGFKWVIAQFSF